MCKHSCLLCWVLLWLYQGNLPFDFFYLPIVLIVPIALSQKRSIGTVKHEWPRANYVTVTNILTFKMPITTALRFILYAIIWYWIRSNIQNSYHIRSSNIIYVILIKGDYLYPIFVNWINQPSIHLRPLANKMARDLSCHNNKLN